MITSYKTIFLEKCQCEGPCECDTLSEDQKRCDDLGRERGRKYKYDGGSCVLQSCGNEEKWNDDHTRCVKKESVNKSYLENVSDIKELDLAYKYLFRFLRSISNDSFLSNRICKIILNLLESIGNVLSNSPNSNKNRMYIHLNKMVDLFRNKVLDKFFPESFEENPDIEYSYRYTYKFLKNSLPGNPLVATRVCGVIFELIYSIADSFNTSYNKNRMYHLLDHLTTLFQDKIYNLPE